MCSPVLCCFGYFCAGVSVPFFLVAFVGALFSASVFPGFDHAHVMDDLVFMLNTDALPRPMLWTLTMILGSIQSKAQDEFAYSLTWSM